MKASLRQTIAFLRFLCVAGFFVTTSAGLLQAQAVDTWKGGTDNWSDGAAWSNGVPDSTGADVYIDGGKTGVASFVTLDGSRTVGRLSLDLGDSVAVPENTVLFVGSGGFTGSSTVINNGTLSLNGGFRETFLLFKNPGSLLGKGQVIMTPSARLFAGTSGDRITIGAGQTIEGAGALGNGQSTVTNSGVVDANVSGAAMRVAPGGGTADFTNTSTGVLEASGGGTLILDGSGNGNTVAGGLVRALDGGQVQLDNKVTVNGSTFATAGSGVVRVVGYSTLVNATITDTLKVNQNTPLFIGKDPVSGLCALTNNGTLSLNADGNDRVSLLIFNSPGSLLGTGSVTMTGASLIYANTSGDRLTIGAGQIIEGAGALGNGGSTVTNNGLVDANVSGAALRVAPGGGTGDFTNAATGVLEASGGGTLILDGGNGKTTNNGTVAVLPGSTVALTNANALANLANDTLTGGTYTVTADTSGTVATLDFAGGTFATNAATVVLSGVNAKFDAIQNLKDNRGTFSLLALRQFTTAASLTNEGTLGFDAGATLHVAGDYVGSSTSALSFAVGGTASQGALSPGLLQVNGNALFAGTLAAGLSAGAKPPGGLNTLTIVSSNGTLAGGFSNAADGARLATANGTGSFQVNYGAASPFGANAVVLSNYTSPSAPEITSATRLKGNAGAPFSYQITATNGPTSYGVTGLPDGLSINPGTGLISGTPTAAGSYTLVPTAVNANGTGSTTLVLTIVPGPPVITSAATATAKVNSAFSYQITATNNPTKYSATGLPGGVGVNTSTGLISGTPTVAGTFSLTLGATNANGTGSASLTLTVQPPVPAITSPATATGTAGNAFSYQIAATNAPTSFSAGGLPGGLTVDPGTGLISGTPAAAGTSTVTLTATNAGGMGSGTLTLTVTPAAPVITSPGAATGTSGSAFSYQVTATNSPTSYGAGGLPGGLSINASTGLVTGTPTAAGTSAVTLTAANAGGTGSATLTLTIQQPVPVLTSLATVNGTVGTAFSYQIAATNNPTSFGVVGLPGGLTYNLSTGLISGTPVAAGTSTLTLTATNGGGTGSATLTLTVAAAPVVVGVPVINSALTATASLPNPFPHLFSYTITGTNDPTSFSAQGLPGGLTCFSSGLIQGYPSAAGTYLVTLIATNSAGNGTATLTLTVGSGSGAPVINSSASASYTPGIFSGPFQYQITATNSPTSFSVDGLPSGLAVTASTGLISGTPTAAGTYTLTLHATNSSGTGSATLTLTVTGGVEVILPTVLTTATTGTAFSYQLVATNHPTSYVVRGLPSGLSANATTGVITGAFTNIGVYDVSFDAYDATGGYETGSLSVNVSQGAVAAGAPVITSATSASAQVGIAFGYQITATNGPTAYAASGLPGGLTFNASTGVISGTPTTAGTSTLALTASNATGVGAGVRVVLSVAAAAPPVITSAATAAVTVGTAFYYQITASGNPTSYGAVGLPAGLTFSGQVISGKPTATGKFSVSLSAANAFGHTSAVLTLSVNPLGIPVINSVTSATATVAAAFSYQITATNAPTSFAASNLPGGLSLNSATGILSGTPPTAGTFTIPISASNSTGKGKSTLILTAVNGRVITSSRTASATVGKPFSYRITATGGPTSYAITGFPANFTINTSTGVLSGTPTTVGTSSPLIEVIYSDTTALVTPLTLTVTAAPKVTVSAVTPPTTSRYARTPRDADDGGGEFVVSLSEPQPSEVVVSFDIAGSAVNGTDYQAIKTTKKFAPGETSKKIRINPLSNGGEAGGKRTVALTLQPGDGYTVATPGKVKVKFGGQ